MTLASELDKLLREKKQIVKKKGLPGLSRVIDQTTGI